ncbi:PD-(D/E)XK nuclease family protein (plasmid) [Fusobacteria bacterium ZRK30]|nr:PD-(D/E)XK nuclease family protein [Fusobacteria bacterium ZRK30]
MSIYSRLLKLYKNNSEKTPKEDFTTEILVGILEKNSEFLDDYVNNFLKIKGEGFEISSQRYYSLEKQNDCRVDIVIENKEKIIFIEKKVDSFEENGQLKRYSELLMGIENKIGYLFYCTKFMKEKKVSYSNFRQFRWKDIYEYYKNSESELLIDFLEYLEEERIVMNKKFNFTDMLVMENIVEMIAKMDEVLDYASHLLSKHFEKCIKHSARSTQIGKNQMYSTYTRKILKGNGYSDVEANFNFNKDKYEVPHLEVVLWIENKSEYYSQFKEYMENPNSDNFKLIIDENKMLIGTSKPIQDFLSSENQIEDMKYWFKEKIEEMSKFKHETRDFGWK